MALVDRFTARSSTQKQFGLSNPDNPDATASNTAELALAAADAEGMFQMMAGQSYDDLDARHRLDIQPDPPKTLLPP